MLARYPKMKDREAVVNEWLYGEGMPPKQPKYGITVGVKVTVV